MKRFMIFTSHEIVLADFFISSRDYNSGSPIHQSNKFYKDYFSIKVKKPCFFKPAGRNILNKYGYGKNQ